MNSNTALIVALFRCLLVHVSGQSLDFCTYWRALNLEKTKPECVMQGKSHLSTASSFLFPSYRMLPFQHSPIITLLIFVPWWVRSALEGYWSIMITVLINIAHINSNLPEMLRNLNYSNSLSPLCRISQHLCQQGRSIQFVRKSVPSDLPESKSNLCPAVRQRLLLSARIGAQRSN